MVDQCEEWFGERNYEAVMEVFRELPTQEKATSEKRIFARWVSLYVKIACVKNLTGDCVSDFVSELARTNGQLECVKSAL